MNLADFLGKKSKSILNSKPFDCWLVDTEYFDEEDTPVIHYVFPKNGFELRCDHMDRISAIFAFLERIVEGDQGNFDMEFGWDRNQILKKYGSPEKCSSGSTHPVLGTYGPWDRYILGNHAVRFEYCSSDFIVKEICYMRGDYIP